MPPAEMLDQATATALRADLGDDHGYRDFLSHWSRLLERRIEQLTAAIAEEDPETAHDVALSLKVTSAMIGLAAFSGAFAQVEHEVRYGDPAGAARALAEARTLQAPARAAVAALLANRATT
jgi:HPt (histidine-containing phosphotransfer) domain-containing protein